MIQVVRSEYVKPGTVLVAGEGYTTTLFMARTECREFTVAEYEGVRARRMVRHGLADILEWLGEEVGPGPDDPLDPTWRFGAAAVPMVDQRRWATLGGL